MCNYTAIFEIETLLEDREFNYSFTSEKLIKFDAPNIIEAFDLALKYIDQRKSPNQTAILEGIVFDGLFLNSLILRQTTSRDWKAYFQNKQNNINI